MIITQTPLRVSFAGGGTDFRGFYEKTHGSVVSAAIDKYIYVIVKQRFDSKIRIGYSKTEFVDTVDELGHELAREAMKIAGVKDGVEISTMADIPSSGSGLGSSSSVTVGRLNALHAYNGEFVSAEQLAREACRIEIDILGRPIGKQDQYIAAYGGLRKFTFNEDDTVTSERIKVPERTMRYLSENLMLFFTGITRKSASVLTEQKSNIDDRMDFLTRMRDMADDLAEVLNQNDLSTIGSTMREGWALKKTLARNVSNETIEAIYNRAMEAGAEAGKITGAGGGGFFLVHTSPQNRKSIRRALSDLKEFPLNLERDGSKVIFNVRR